MILKKIQLWRWAVIIIGWGIILVAIHQLYNNMQNYSIENFKNSFTNQIIETNSLVRNYQLLIDNRSSSDEELTDEILKNLPNLPATYFQKNKNVQWHHLNESCAVYPSMLDIKFDSVYWQTLNTSNGTFYFFSAYFDNRLKSNPCVRIMTLINRIQATVKIYCQFWFDNIEKPIIVKAMDHIFLWERRWGGTIQGEFYTYLVTCPIPANYSSLVPSSVSVVEKLCDSATNNIRVIYNKPKNRKKFAVCVKGLDFYKNDLSLRLVEWLELLFLLGADKVFFHQLHIHSNVTKVLKYYEQKGKVDVTPLTLPGGQPNAPVFQHIFLVKKLGMVVREEIIAYNDCLYKNLHSYEYVVLLDIDEVIIPVKDLDWYSLMERMKNITSESKMSFDSYNVRNVYFLNDLILKHGWFKDIPLYMHMLQHVYRTRNFTCPGCYVKCFHDTQRVLTLHNHFPFACLNSHCMSYSIDTEDAQLQHYRADCAPELRSICGKLKNDSVMDNTIWKYKEKLISTVTETLTNLGFLDYN